MASFHKALRETLNLDVTDEFIERRIGVGAAETFREILNEKSVSYDNALIGQLLKVKIRVQIALASEVKLFPGALELLEVLNGKVRETLASMNNRKVIDHMLFKLKVKDCFSVVVTGDEVCRSKPDPEIFLKSALKAGSKPEHCVVVEDSIFGLKAAREANMGCVAVLTGVYSREELEVAKPDLIVESLTEKGTILNFILEKSCSNYR